MSLPYSVPHRWSPSTHFNTDNIVWYAGCYWKCEQSHQSGEESSGAPTLTPHLWTLTTDPTTQPPTHLGYNIPPPSYHYPTGANTAADLPPYGSHGHSPYPPSRMHQYEDKPSFRPIRGDSGSSEKYDTDTSASSSETITEKNQDLAENETRGYISEKAESVSDAVIKSMRFVVTPREQHDAKDEDELKRELKGKRVWKAGGIGMWAYNEDDEHEQLKRKVWRDFGETNGKDEWLKSARARTDHYNKDTRGLKPLIKWKLVERGGHLPDDALPIGHEADGTFLYAARAWFQGGLHLGKAGHHLVNNASISWGGQEHTMDIYEVLCGPTDDTLLQWRNYTHGEHAKVEGWQPVEGGREKDGLPLFIAKGEYEGGVHPGKCLINDDHACVGWGGGELWVRPFQVLAYCSSRR